MASPGHDVRVVAGQFTLGDVVFEVGLSHKVAGINVDANVVTSVPRQVSHINPLAIHCPAVDVVAVGRDALVSFVCAIPFSLDSCIALGILETETSFMTFRCFRAIP